MGLINIIDYFKDDNVLASLVDNYTYRPKQALLAEEIYRVFNDNEFLVAEAGTGIGKSYAYLIPAILWAHNEGEKVVISTRTKALQQQLVEKDIPHIKQALKLDIKVAEAKGRENYLCWYKYMQILAGKQSLSPEEAVFVDKILAWAERTKTGDKKELSLKSDIMNKWYLVAADRKSCAKNLCPYTDKCFRLKMIRKLEKAELIIINHALLLSDIVVDNSILPAYEYLIIDEAHHIDKEAFSRLAKRVSFAELEEILNSFNVNKPYKKGLLPKLKKEIPEEIDAIEECIKLTERAKILLADFQEKLKSELNKNNKEQHATVIKNALKDKLLALVTNAYFELIEVLNRLIFQIESLKVEEADLLIVYSLLKDNVDYFYGIMEEDIEDNEAIVWVEWYRGEIKSIISSKISIGSILNTSLYKKLKTLILLSATITIDGKFDYFINKSGLAELEDLDRLNTFISESPFDYDKNAKMLVVTNLPPPDSIAYIKEITSTLLEIISVTKGKTLILFTSRKQMLDCASLLRPHCEKKGINLLVQNEDGEATNLLDMFMLNENSVLLGLDSFWEGIDLKGEILTYLVIVKLPFRAPNDPFSEANNKHYTNQNLKSFVNFALPDAVMRFKQGTGRLIRSENDTGVVIVLDERLNTKGYGKSFLNSIPIKKIHYINKDSLNSYLEGGC